jgi:hypothetical protein
VRRNAPHRALVGARGALELTHALPSRYGQLLARARTVAAKLQQAPLPHERTHEWTALRPHGPLPCVLAATSPLLAALPGFPVRWLVLIIGITIVIAIVITIIVRLMGGAS